MKKLTAILASAFALFAVTTATAQTKDEIQKKFNEAATKYNAKDYASAITLFEETLKLTDTTEDDVLELIEQSQGLIKQSYFFQGLKNAKGGKFDEALVDFNSAKDLASLSGDLAYENRCSSMIGNVYFAQGSGALKAGDTAKAADCFFAGYADNKKNTKVGLAAAQCYANVSNFEKSTEIYKEIIALGETHSKYEAAATKASSDLVSSLATAAATAATNKDYEGVTKYVDEALAIDSTNASIQLIRVQAANNLKKVNDVIKYGEEAAAAQTDAATASNVYFYIGSAYQVKENKAKAIAAYSKVTEGANVEIAKEMIKALTAVAQ